MASLSDPACATSWDVAVLGGGPAGAAAAITAARLGLSTVLVQTPGAVPPCLFETAAIDFARALTGLGVRPSAVGLPCRFPGQGTVGATGLQVDRARLGAELRTAAAKAGAVIIDDKATAVLRSGDQVAGLRLAGGQAIRSAALIDASGAAGWLRRRLDLPRQSLSVPLLAARGEVSGRLDCLGDDGALFQPTATGWIFLAARQGVVGWTTLASKGARPSIPANLKALPTRIPARSHLVTWQLVRPFAGPGWFIAGEAGGRVDPACGSGLADSIEAGIRAAQSAALCRDGPGRAHLTRAAYDGWCADLLHNRAADLEERYAAAGIRLANADSAKILIGRRDHVA